MSPNWFMSSSVISLGSIFQPFCSKRRIKQCYFWGGYSITVCFRKSPKHVCILNLLHKHVKHTVAGSNCFIVVFRYQGLLSYVHIFRPISCSHQMFLTVYLSNNDQHFTEVPITPETLCRDVVELCKEPGEMDCHLSEMWRGSGNLVGLLADSPQCHVWLWNNNLYSF